MKKIMMTLAAVLCCAMLTTVFTACSKDNDENTTQPPQETATPDKAVMTCTLSVSPETTTAFDVKVKYYDAEGNKHEEIATWTDAKKDGKDVKQWVKNVSKKLPAKLGMYMELSPKEGIDLTIDHKFQYKRELVFTSYNTDNGILDQKDCSGGLGGTVKANEMDTYMSKIGKIANYVANFDEKGYLPKNSGGMSITTTWEE